MQFIDLLILVDDKNNDITLTFKFIFSFLIFLTHCNNRPGNRDNIFENGGKKSQPSFFF